MKARHLLTASVASLFLTLSGCGGGSSDGAGSATSSGGSAAARVQPPEGVPAGTSPLPLPEYGKAYNNPQPRDNIRDGGEFTLPIGRIGPNLNYLHIDGHNGDVGIIWDWLMPRFWDYSPSGAASPNENFLQSYEVVSESPQVVKFVLNPLAKWNDGTPIDWKSVELAWRVQRGGTNSPYAPASSTGYDAIEKIERGATDHEAIVTFSHTFYPLEALFSELVHPKNEDPEFFNNGWINKLDNNLLAGPFRVASMTENVLVLERNPNWWGNPAKLDKVTFRQMELAASINAFQNGEIDATNVAISDRLRQVSGMANVQIRRGFDTRTIVYVLGTASAFFKEPEARRAFMIGTDRRLLAKIDFQGLDWEEEPPGSTVMFNWQDGYKDNIPDLHYDADKARKELDAAGWTVGADGYRYKNGQRAEFTYVTFGDDPSLAALARAQQQMSKDIGLLMNIDIRKSADFAPTLSKGRRDFDVLIMAWGATDPFSYASGCQLFCSDSESNLTGLGSPEIDELLKKVTTIRDVAQATEIANRGEELALHLYGMFPLQNGPRMTAVKKGLVHVGPAGFWVPRTEDIGWQKEPSAGGSSTGGR